MNETRLLWPYTKVNSKRIKDLNIIHFYSDKITFFSPFTQSLKNYHLFFKKKKSIYRDYPYFAFQLSCPLGLTLQTTAILSESQTALFKVQKTLYAPHRILLTRLVGQISPPAVRFLAARWMPSFRWVSFSRWMNFLPKGLCLQSLATPELAHNRWLIDVEL